MKPIKKMINKLKIYYAPDAFSKTVRLVTAHSMEIGWNMVIKPYKDGYKVYDILIYPQKASSAYLDIDLGRYGLWKASLTEEQDANLFGQGHSHVNMAVFPSGRDQEQQIQEVCNKGKGFYFFQIWNKKLEINSFFYDIDNNLLYEKEDIDLILEDDEFIEDSRKKLIFDLPDLENNKEELIEVEPVKEL